MRFLTSLSFLALALPFVVLGGTGARAEPMPKAVIAVLDYAKILQASDAAKDIRRQVKQYTESFRDVIQIEEHRLREIEAELKRQRDVSSPEAYEEKRQKFKSQVITAQRQGQDFRRNLDKTLKSATDELQGAIISIVKILTKEKGYTIVVDNSQVLIANSGLDITKEVMDRLNQKLRTVTVSKPQ
ncbi:MAG: OmpH family outer membrane protein [Alphaproteobacteria bacterium]|nr:OmpH family outer membrane protein [Alphaproteobacteria bacterium]